MPLSLVSENIIAYELYQSFGFKKTGEIADLEEIMVLPLTKANNRKIKKNCGFYIYPQFFLLFGIY
jgi:hypothetical protein